MGFMSGFATGFGNQISQGMERKSQKERDALNIAMERWNKRTTEYNTQAAADKKLQEQAKAIAASNGLPEGAWVDIYQQRLLPGDTFTGAEKWATSQNWAVQEQEPSMPETPAPPTAQDQEMSDSGLAPGQENTAGQQDPGILGSMAGAVGDVLGTLGNPQAQQERLFQGANERATAQLGITPEQQAQYETGYQPNIPPSSMTFSPKPDGANLEDFNKNYQVLFVKGPDGRTMIGQGVWDEATGQWLNNRNQPIQGSVDRSMPQDAYNDYVEAVKLVNPEVAKLNQQKDSVMDVAVEASNISTIVSQNPRVLTIAGQASSIINDGITNLVSIAEATGGVTSPEFKEAESSLIQSAQQGMGNIGEDANDFAAFTSAKLKFAFAAARANAGPTGPLSNQEVQQAMQMFSTADPQDFNRQVQQFVSLQINAYDRRAQNMMANDLGVETARMQGIDVDRLFGPIMTTVDDETRQFLESNFTSSTGPSGANTDAAATAGGNKLLQGTNLQTILDAYPQLKSYEGEIYLSPAGELVDADGNPIGGDTEQ